jgi:hypothetical protein
MDLNRRRFLALSAGVASSAKAHPLEWMGAVDPQTSSQGEKFLLGVEYYRAPMPPQEFWDHDFAAIRKSGMRIVRTFSYWNWIEPQPGKYELDDFDRFFETARKHDLLIWFDLTLATHGAAPEWMMRKHPDMRVASATGQVALETPPMRLPRKPMALLHHPKWKEYGESLLRAVVGRYKDAPNLHVECMGRRGPDRRPRSGSRLLLRPYHRRPSAVAQAKVHPGAVERRLHRRYRDWADVAPGSDSALVEMLLARVSQ